MYLECILIRALFDLIACVDIANAGPEKLEETNEDNGTLEKFLSCVHRENMESILITSVQMQAALQHMACE